jgi:V8-like Glu-specific endopeptidase
MSFSIDDYEKAIARIFRKTEENYYPIGTGFLIAPGYVMTCAHVVLQAIGFEESKYSEKKDKPDEKIFLDFPIVENCRKEPLAANVIEWIPYEHDGGDVAILKLMKANNYNIKPLPLIEVKREEVEQERHSIYGFPQEEGTRSDAYQPKSNVAGGRWQLCKFGDPKDETIQPGFSGGPIWNYTRKSIVGMVATARVNQEKAFAITTETLRPTLKKVEAFCLIDILNDHLNLFKEEENEEDKLRRSINNTLRDCDPNSSNQDWQEQIHILNSDLPPVKGWEQEGRLVRWVMALAGSYKSTDFIYRRLKEWINKTLKLDFYALLGRITEEIRDRKISYVDQCEHLLVSLKSAEKPENQDLYLVSIWPIANLDRHNPQSPAKHFALNKEITLDGLPEFIFRNHRANFSEQPTTIHLFVPRNLLGHNLDMQPFGRTNKVLGSEYPLVTRTNLSVHPIVPGFYNNWQQKWQRIEEMCLDQYTCNIFEDIDCECLDLLDCDKIKDLVKKIKNNNALIIQKCSSLPYLFDLIVEDEYTPLPIALWSREPTFEGNLVNLLGEKPLREFPTQIQEARQQATQDSNALGHHLSLMWENPNILPPDMQFSQENL